MILSTIQRNVDGTIGYMGDFWFITAASEQVGYPASNLLTPDLNQKWVSWGQRASHNWIEAVSDSRGVLRYITLAALLGIDRTYPSQPSASTLSSNTYRVIIDERFPVATRRRPPVQTITLTNLVGTAATINGPIDPPDLTPPGYTTTYMTATNPAINTVLKADFYNYNATERELSPVGHTIRVHVRNSANPAPFPVISTKMRYNGFTVGSDLVSIDIEQTSEGWMFTYLFNPAAGPIGAATSRIGIEVTGVAIGGSVPVPIGVEWIAELAGWGTDGLSWDSNVDTRNTPTIQYPQIVELPEKESLDPFTQEIVPYELRPNVVLAVYFELSDWVQTVGDDKIPLGGFQNAAFYAGRLVIAEGIDIDLEEIGGYARRKSSDVSILRTYGGTLRGTRNALHWDEHDFNARIQSQSSLAGELDTFFENAGMRNPVVLIPDEAQPGQAIYGILTRWEASDVGAHIEPGNDIDDAEPYYDLSFSAIDARARRTLR